MFTLCTYKYNSGALAYLKQSIQTRLAFLKLLLAFSFVYLCLFSCKPTELVYLKDDSILFAEDEKDSLYVTQPSKYLLQPEDYLYIQIFSPEKIVEEELKSQTSKSGGSSQMSYKNDYLNGYVIGDDGYIEIPIMGKVKMGGLTVEEAQLALQKKVDEFLINAKAVVKLLNFKVTFMGEVSQRGAQYFYQREVNIFEGLAAVGGITDAGKIGSVLVLRRKGKNFHSTRVDLTKRSILTEPDFYLKPNDIVYVEPNKSKIFRLTLSDYAITISAITSTITSLILIINFSK